MNRRSTTSTNLNNNLSNNVTHRDSKTTSTNFVRKAPSSRNRIGIVADRSTQQPKQFPLSCSVLKCGIVTIALFWIIVAYNETSSTSTKGNASESNQNLRSGSSKVTNNLDKSDIQNKMHHMANAAFESAQLAFHEAQKEAKLLAEAAKKREQQLISKLEKGQKGNGSNDVQGAGNGATVTINDKKIDITGGVGADDETPVMYEPPWEHDNIERPGFVVLGMHRSGTSMLSGLLVTGFGYKTGGPLIGPAFDNAKGFFERVDIVLQNDVFMWSQKIDWANNVVSYDGDKAYEEYSKGNIKFEEHGKPGLTFLNDRTNSPWLQKDPRMCITLKTWIPLVKPSPPAVVFTYRHPLEVAMSLKKRERSFPLERGLRLWIVYNMRAIQNAKGLCIVYSSNEHILENPLQEVQRISDQLTSKCNVLSPPTKILTQERVDVFVDPTLRHNKQKSTKDSDLEEGQILERHGDCVVPKYDTDDHTKDNPREIELYKKSMKIYCDLKTGDAYRNDYVWPTLS